MSSSKGPEDCPEGGKHDFPEKPTAGSYISCCLCLPCLMICSCMMSEGSAFANPAMEQSCGSKQQGVCSKCSLTIEETASYWNNNVQKAEQKELRKSYAAGQAMDQVAFTSQPGMREDMQVSPNADQPRNLRS